MPWSLGIVWTLASGVAMALLGLALMGVRPRRGSTMLFSGFCLAWGLQIVAINVSRGLSPHPAEELLFRLSLAFVPPTYLFLGFFITSYPLRASSRTAGAVTWTLATLAVGALGAFFVAPHALLEGIVATSQGAVPDYGPADLPLLSGPLFAAFDFAALWLLHMHRRAKGVTRHQLRLLLAGVLLYASYANVAFLAPLLTDPGLVLVLGPEGLGFLALFGAGTLLVAAITVRLAALRPPEGPDPLLLACAIVPAAFAVAQQALLVAGFSRVFETLGVWRLLSLALIAYAVARFQLFDLDLKLQGAIRRAAPLAAAGLAGAIVLTAFESAGPGVALAAMVAAAVPSGLASWLWRDEAAKALFPAETSDPDYRYHRKIEVYRAALERVLADKSPDPTDEDLMRRLRHSLAITDREHQLLEYLLQRGLGSLAAGPQPRAPVVAPGTTLLGRFRAERLLGEGGYGRAYLAQDEKLDRQVVVKVVTPASLDEHAAKLLLREARLAGSLKHPNIIGVYDVIEGSGETFIVMEYADGGSLDELLRRRGALSLEEATAALEQVLAALEAVHAKGVVHRDIKPQNILLMKDGTLKLADFGIARAGQGGPDTARLSVTGTQPGTLLYMSPEQVRGVEVDQRADLYAAGVVFHQALTGRFYVRVAGKDDFQVRQLILRGQPALGLKDQPAWVEGFLQKALAKDPAKRFQSAAEMRAVLRRAVPVTV